MQTKRFTVTISTDAAERLTQLGGTLSNGIELAAYFDPKDVGVLFNRRIAAKYPPTAKTVPTPEPYVYMPTTPNPKHKPPAQVPDVDDDLAAAMGGVFNTKPEPVYSGNTYTGWLELIAKSEAEALEMEGDELNDREYALSVAREHAEEARRLRDEQAEE